jgi:hypothetical protein
LLYTCFLSYRLGRMKNTESKNTESKKAVWKNVE